MSSKQAVKLTPEVMFAAIKDLAREEIYPQCFGDVCGMFSSIVRCNGADFVAGAVARDAVVAGADPMRFVEFFVKELVPLAREWQRPPLRDERRDPNDLDERSEEFLGVLRSERVKAFETLGFARGLASGEFEPGAAYEQQDYHGMYGDDLHSKQPEIVAAAMLAVTFALDVRDVRSEVNNSEVVDVAELSARSMVRAIGAVFGRSKVEFNPGALLERLQMFAAAETKKAVCS